MKKDIEKHKDKFLSDFYDWTKKYNYRLVAFNLIIIFIFMLRSAGYFQPYFPISVNFIVIVGLLLAVIMLGARAKFIFLSSLLFWIFAGILKLLKIDVWAERSGVYVYEMVFMGIVVFVF